MGVVQYAMAHAAGGVGGFAPSPHNMGPGQDNVEQQRSTPATFALALAGRFLLSAACGPIALSAWLRETKRPAPPGVPAWRLAFGSPGRLFKEEARLTVARGLGHFLLTT